MLTLAQLLTARTKEDYLAQLLTALQGVGYVQKDGTGSGSARSSGVAANGYQVVFLITTAGGLSTAAFTVSLDGGATYGSAIAMPANGVYTVPSTGLTMQFTEGPANGIGNSFEVADTYSVTLTVPTFPATAWQEGSAPLTQEEKLSETLEQQSALIRAVSAGGYLSTATGDWLTLLAHEVYEIDRKLGQAAIGIVQLTNNTASAISVGAGTVWVGTLDGLRFSNLSAATIASGAMLPMLFRAEKTGAAYNIAAGGITTLFSSIPGVTVNNPNPTGSSWIVTSGTDTQSDASLIAACQARWPSLSQGATAAVYEDWALTASPNVTRAKVIASPTVGGQVLVYLAGAAGGVDLTTVNSVNTYMQPRIPFPSTLVVASATNHPITITAQVFAYIGQGAAASAALVDLLSDYAQTLSVGPTVYVTKLIELLQSPVGVRNVVLTSPSSDITLAATEVATFTLAISVAEV